MRLCVAPSPARTFNLVILVYPPSTDKYLGLMMLTNLRTTWLSGIFCFTLLALVVVFAFPLVTTGSMNFLKLLAFVRVVEIFSHLTREQAKFRSSCTRWLLVLPNLNRFILCLIVTWSQEGQLHFKDVNSLLYCFNRGDRTVCLNSENKPFCSKIT